MFSRMILAVALLVVSAASWSAMTDCQADCETIYKACAKNRTKSENACRVEYEKWRKACAKKAGKPSPN